jgi:hypothetical protein
MTSTSVTDFLISFSFLVAGGYALLARAKGAVGKPDVRDRHEAIQRNPRP